MKESLRKEFDDLHKRAKSSPKVRKILEIAADMESALGPASEGDDIRLPYSSDPRPIEKPWQSDFSD